MLKADHIPDYLVTEIGPASCNGAIRDSLSCLPESSLNLASIFYRPKPSCWQRGPLKANATRDVETSQQPRNKLLICLESAA